MIVCLVSQEDPEKNVGGIGNQTWNKARALAKLGHTVHILSSSTHGPDMRVETEDGVIIHRMMRPGLEFPIYEQATYLVGYSWSVLRNLRKLMKKITFDLIDFAEYGGEGFAFQLDRSQWSWIPVVVQLHGPMAMFAKNIGWPEMDSDFYRVGTLMEEASIKKADGLMACSENIADFTASFYGISLEDIDVIHTGVDSEIFSPPNGKKRKERPTVLFVGNIAESKGIGTVFEAVLRLRSKYPNILLKITGKGDKNLLQKLQLWAHREGAESNIEFVGFVERARLPDLYRQASVFCSPATHECGVANVYIEAMACGCPVVASTSGGACEVVVDEKTGLLVAPANVESTKAALDRILGDTELQISMGKAARRRVEEYFSMDKYILRVIDTYKKAIERSQKNLAMIKNKL